MAKNRVRKVFEQEEEDGGEFSTVYGDLMSFMMMLFLMLYILVNASVSQSDAAKEVLENIKKSLNKEQVTETIQEVNMRLEKRQEEELKKYALVKELQEYVEQEKLEKYVEIEDDNYKIKITLAQPILFRSGEAELKKDFLNVLDKLGTLFAAIDNAIVIEGHTDSDPIKSRRRFDSNWDLSFARAYNVVKYLTQHHRIDPQRFSIIGYGEYRPKVPNTSITNKAKNRRIEVSVLFNTAEEESETKAKLDSGLTSQGLTTVPPENSR